MPKGRLRTGYVYFDEKRKTWAARVTYRDDTGRVRNVKRQVENRTEGKQLLKRLIADIDDRGAPAIEGDKLTFRHLAELYRQERITEPVYKGDTKVSGLRSRKAQLVYLAALTEYFGAKRIRAIRHRDLEKFRAERMQSVTIRGRERSAASVNRELELLRAMLGYAKRAGWIARNPFEEGAPLIHKADEVHRDRVLSAAEEERLLAACVGRREHLRPLLIAALDTALRKGELLQLRWVDIDLTEGLIQVRATTTKTMKARTVGITARLADELRRMQGSAADPKGLVFGVTDDVKKSFNSACRGANIAELRFHDLRHTAITRWVEAGLPPMQIMRVSGHTQMQTFIRYVSADDQAAKRAALTLDELRHRSEAERAKAEEKPELAN